jgi:hypothetical protein
MSTELTTADFQALDRLDEEQIVAELQGAVLDEYVYSFKSGGKTVTGLSWAGVKAIAARMGSIELDLLQLVNADASYLCVVKATAPDGSSRIGAAEQPKAMSTRNGEQPDPFALPKVTSKAQRNAIRALLPETLITELVKMHAEQAKVIQGNGHNGAPGSGHNGASSNGNGKSSQDPMTTFWAAVRQRGISQDTGRELLVQAGGDAVQALALLQ